MEVVARKSQKMGLVIIQFIVGILLTGVGFIIIPIVLFGSDPEAVKDPFIWLVALICMAFFGLVGYFADIRQLILFKKSPDVQAETDGEYLYIHGKKEAKIPLVDMKDAELDSVEPYVMSHEFIVHLFSERYGKVIIKVPNYGKYKLYFISESKAVVLKISNLVIEKCK